MKKRAQPLKPEARPAMWRRSWSLELLLRNERDSGNPGQDPSPASQALVVVEVSVLTRIGVDGNDQFAA